MADLRRTPIEDLRLTDPQAAMLSALRGLCDEPRPDGKPHGSATPREVAKKRWPNSPGWEKRTRRYGGIGNGAVGGTMPMKAATVLWRLDERGLATEGDGRWSITDRGRAWLAQHDTTDTEATA